MRIVVVGVNHATGPLDVRERLAVPAGELDGALAELKSVAREGFIVSTCNRMEVYGLVGHDASGAEALLRFLADRSGFQIAAVRSTCYVHAHDAAVRHALRVASGLDSVVLGEDQIQGQIRCALASAKDAGALGTTLDRLGSSALACGKRVRTFTGVGHHAVSLESLAVRALAERLAPLRTKSAVVIGAGESAALVVRHLKGSGVGKITIVSRSHERASALAGTVEAGTRRWTELSDALVDADAVFGCTSAAQPVITPSVLAHWVAVRGNEPLLCVDLGMPRDVDESVASIANVALLTLDELARMAEAHRAARREYIPAAEAIVEAEAQRFLDWLNARGVAETIAGMSEYAESVAEHELARALPRLQSLSPQERAVVTELAHRIVRKLMHRPINALKRNTDVEEMPFGITGLESVS